MTHDPIIFSSIPKEGLIQDITDSVISRLVPLLSSHHTKSNDSKEYWTILETADYLKVSKVTVHDYVKRGILQKHKIGNRTLFNKSEVLDSIRSIESKNQ